MTVSRTQQFTEADAALAAWAKALAHPARVAILRVLAARKTCICGEIVDALPLAQATVSQHLKALKAAGLVQGTIDGPRSCYCLDAAALRRARAAFGAFFDGLDLDGCC
ncbi:MAG: metalloregulator ArsR/SmtB family transcription factor [Rhodothermales bacterium]|nr:metalloregulator ArsR/SmtB family transcription factor [Rhodothermales bacterium]